MYKNNTNMKNVFFRTALFLMGCILIVSSCSKDKETTGRYFVSKSLKVSYPATYINTLIDGVSAYFPDAVGLKQYVSGAVDVYKVVYKTTVNDESVNASGLICVPTAEGEYPVLCFQNGTNTLDSDAPSVNFVNQSYQVIEMVASMGYIVLIPDYPGFGESSEIPHPYLITEPTVSSIVDMLFALKEMVPAELPGKTIKDEYYLMGYSQGGWATLALHKAIERDYPGDFNLKGSVCGAGPYDLNLLLKGMTDLSTYSNPAFIGYIVYAYTEYNQFSNPASDILNEQYASKLGSLYTGDMSSGQINEQLTTSIPELINPAFISGFESDARYQPVRNALSVNSIAPWKTTVPLLFVHGGNDVTVNPVTTENIYNGMIGAGTSASVCTKEIIPGVDHREGIVPCMVRGLLFLLDLKGSV